MSRKKKKTSLLTAIVLVVMVFALLGRAYVKKNTPSIELTDSNGKIITEYVFNK